MLCYSVNEVIGFNKKSDEPILRRKRKKYYLGVSLSDYESINVRRNYRLVQKEVKQFEKVAQSDSMSLPHWVKDYVSNPNRYGNVVEDVTLGSDDDVLKVYMKWLRHNSPRHMDLYEHLIDGKEIFEEYLNDYRTTTTRYGTPPTKNTISNNYTRIKGFFNWLHDKDDRFPFNMMKMKGFASQRNKEKLPPATSRSDMISFIKWMEVNKDNKYEMHFIPILRMLLLTGCRIGEVVTMKIEDIDIKEKTWNFFGKTKRRTIKLDSETLWESLNPWIFDSNGKVRTDKEWVFHCEYWRKPNKTNGKGGGVKMILDKHITTNGVAHKFKKVVNELGLNPKLSPHSCRRGWITYMLEKGRPIQEIAHLVGHSTYEMVFRYSRQQIPKERTTIDFSELIEEGVDNG
jgi:integrase